MKLEYPRYIRAFQILPEVPLHHVSPALISPTETMRHRVCSGAIPFLDGEFAYVGLEDGELPLEGLSQEVVEILRNVGPHIRHYSDDDLIDSVPNQMDRNLGHSRPVPQRQVCLENSTVDSRRRSVLLLGLLAPQLDAIQPPRLVHQVRKPSESKFSNEGMVRQEQPTRHDVVYATNGILDRGANVRRGHEASQFHLD